jgi:lactate dehydrogenase-like 2-hydroxyacid dehydrogenase
LELLSIGLRGSIGVVRVNNLALTEGVVLGVVGHGGVEVRNAKRARRSKVSICLSDEHVPTKLKETWGKRMLNNV